MLRRNVLIFHSGALGDFVLNWPLAVALGRLYPQSRIICVCGGDKGRLLERVLRLEYDDVETGWGALFGKNPSVLERIERTLRGAHTLCSFIAGADSDWAANVKRLAPSATMLPIDPKLPERFSGHAIDHVQAQLASQPVIATAVEQMRRSIAERGTGMAIDPTGPIVLHPGAGSLAKCWPLKCFEKLADRLTSAGRRVQWIVGEVEADRWPVDALPAARRIETLVELLDVLRGASAFVGNDSGPAHLAGILGLPTVALFGPTDPVQWRPLGPRVKTIRNAAMEQIGVDEVIEQFG